MEKSLLQRCRLSNSLQSQATRTAVPKALILLLILKLREPSRAFPTPALSANHCIQIARYLIYEEHCIAQSTTCYISIPKSESVGWRDQQDKKSWPPLGHLAPSHNPVDMPQTKNREIYFWQGSKQNSRTARRRLTHTHSIVVGCVKARS
jgi:hypothetical protein